MPNDEYGKFFCTSKQKHELSPLNRTVFWKCAYCGISLKDRTSLRGEGGSGSQHIAMLPVQVPVGVKTDPTNQ